MPANRHLLALFTFAAASLHTSPAAPQAVPPAIFGIGFTNITDSSARLVFTTAQPLAATIDVYNGATRISHQAEPAPLEIHSIPLSSLPARATLRVHINDTEIPLHLGQRRASTHAWPGYTIFSSTTQGDSPATLDLLVQAGVRMVRIEPSWDGLYPHRGQLNQAFLDRFVARVAALKARNIEPLVILDYSVAWAMPGTQTTMTWRNKNFGPPDSLADWQQYVRTIATALSPTARYYEIWNEPDAGYLATGSFVERPDLPPPIGRPPFKDNIPYWIGDRYVPIVEATREVIDQVNPNAIVMNGGWNRDYTGQRGDILFDRGAAPCLDVYAYHVYTHAPVSFSRWFQEIDGQFRTNIDRIFTAHHVSMPLAVTEWGWQAMTAPDPAKGFMSFADSQFFYLKSTFYFLAQQRFELLSQFSLGLGPASRARDPDYFMLVNSDSDGKPVISPTYSTFKFLATTFGSTPYRALPVKTPPDPNLKAYAIQLRGTGAIYLAAWQDGPAGKDGGVAPLDARTVAMTLSQPGAYTLNQLDVDGTILSTRSLKSLSLQVPLPAATSTEESPITLYRLTPTR